MSSHEPVWTSHPTPSAPAALPDRVQVVVIGAGIAGLSTAVRLGRAGVRTLLATADVVGGGVTGRSNSKVTALRLCEFSGLANDGLMAAMHPIKISQNNHGAETL